MEAKSMKKLIIIGACVVFAVILVIFGTKVLAPTPETPLLNSTAPAHFTDNTFENFGYILTTPQNATENMPLIVYLHGSNSRGSDPNYLLQQAGFPRSLILGELENIPAYVLIPQLSADITGWERVKSELMRLIDKVAADCKADTSKICLTGYSMGGTGAWKLAATYPDKFSCLVPISGSIANIESNRQALKDMPIWAFVSNADTTVLPSYTTEFVTDLQPLNENCTATVLDGAAHEATWQIYQYSERSIFQWMLEQ